MQTEQFLFWSDMTNTERSTRLVQMKKEVIFKDNETWFKITSF